MPSSVLGVWTQGTGRASDPYGACWGRPRLDLSSPCATLASCLYEAHKTSTSIQLTLEKHMFKLCMSTYTCIIFLSTCTTLLHTLWLVGSTDKNHTTRKVDCKVILDFPPCKRVCIPNPHVVPSQLYRSPGQPQASEGAPWDPPCFPKHSWPCWHQGNLYSDWNTLRQVRLASTSLRIPHSTTSNCQHMQLVVSGRSLVLRPLFLPMW